MILETLVIHLFAFIKEILTIYFQHEIELNLGSIFLPVNSSRKYKNTLG